MLPFSQYLFIIQYLQLLIYNLLSQISNMSSPDPSKYPKNQIYNNSSKPAFQPTSKSNQQKHVVNISGTSLAELSNSANSIHSANFMQSPKSSKGSAQLAILYERIQYLQKQLEMVTQLLLEEEEKKKAIQKLQQQNAGLKQNMEKVEELNAMLEKQLARNQSNNKQLINALKSVSEELESLKAEHSESKNINESKNSKSREEVQQDIIRLNQQISNVLLKLHTLNEDYEILRQKNEVLESQNAKILGKLSQQQQSLSKPLNLVEKYKSQLEYSKQEVNLLKQQINQVNDLSIQKQKQMQDAFEDKQNSLKQQIQRLQELLKNENSNNKKSEDRSESSTLVEIKNSKIRALEIDVSMLKRELEGKEEQLAMRIHQSKGLQIQLSTMQARIQQMTQNYKQNARSQEWNHENRVRMLEQHIKDLKNIEYKYHSVEAENYKLISKLREQQQRIYSMQYNQAEKNKEFLIKQLQQQVAALKSKYNQKGNQISAIEHKKMEVIRQLEQVKGKLLSLQFEVRTTNEAKQRYGAQLSELKRRMAELQRLSQDQQRHIREVENSQQNSRKKIQDISIIETTHMHKLDDVQQINKELEKMLLNQKMQKQTQNKRYRELLEDYKQLNHQLSIQLKLYRDAQNFDHGHCPINQFNVKDSFSSKQKTTFSRKIDNQDIKRQLQKQRSKYQSLLQQHEKTLQRCKDAELRLSKLHKQQNQSNFLKIDNSSLRAQVTQLNIWIQEHKAIIDSMKKQAESRNNDTQKLRYSMQREYQGKLQMQKMDIINQYNVLLQARNIRIDPTQFGKWNSGKRPHIQPELNYHQTGRQEDRNQIPEMEKIRYHPQYKKLQQQYMKLHRQFLQSEHMANKSITECRDEIQKLRIQNQYHRKTIDEMHAQGYGLYPEDGSRGSNISRASRQDLQLYKNKYEQINRNYQSLYNQYIVLKSRNGRIQDDFPNSNEKLRQLLSPIYSSQSGTNKKVIETAELDMLKKIIDQKLVQLQITPRQPASTVQRAVWVIQKLSALIIQLRQDLSTVKEQKKQLKKQNDKLKVRLQTTDYQKSHLLQQLSVALQKFKYLQQKHLKLSQGSFYSPKQTSMQIPHLPINANHQIQAQFKSNEKDIHLHEAGLIRQQRISLLRKYQREIESIDSNAN